MNFDHIITTWVKRLNNYYFYLWRTTLILVYATHISAFIYRSPFFMYPAPLLFYTSFIHYSTTLFSLISHCFLPRSLLFTLPSSVHRLCCTLLVRLSWFAVLFVAVMDFFLLRYCFINDIFKFELLEKWKRTTKYRRSLSHPSLALWLMKEFCVNLLFLCYRSKWRPVYGGLWISTVLRLFENS